MNLSTISKEFAAFESVKKKEIITHFENLLSKYASQTTAGSSFGPKIQVIQFSEVVASPRMVLSAEYYNKPYQLNTIIENLKSRNLPDGIAFLHKIVDAGVIKTSARHIKLHPEIISEIQKII